MDKKISIIVPVYKTEEYLEKCLTSLVNQTLKDIEVIVVNDGSPDNSINIMNKYMDQFPDIIKCFTKPNGGLSDARNFGIYKATGEYIGFVDSDDYIEVDMYEKLYNKAKEKNFDVVASDVYIVYPNTTKKDIVSSGVSYDTFNKEEIKSIMTVIYPTAWNKIYKRTLLDNISFTKNIWFEDVDFLLRLFPSINSIGVCNIPLYNYLQRDNSITYTYNEKLYNIIDNMDNVIAFYKEKNLYDEYFDELEYLYSRYSLATFPKRLAKSKNINKYKEGIKYSMNKLNKLFPEYTKNKYLKKVGLKGKYIKYFNKHIAYINFVFQNIKKYN